MANSKDLLYTHHLNEQNSYIIAFSYKYIYFYRDHGQLYKGDEAYRIDNPYKYSDFYDEQGRSLFRFTSRGDYVYICHPKYPLKTLIRYGDTDWQIRDFQFENGPWENVEKDEATLTEEGGVYNLSISNYGFKDTDLGRLIRITQIDDGDIEGWNASKEVTEEEVLSSDNKFYKALKDGTTGAIKPVHTQGVKSDGEVPFEYLHAGYCVFEIVEVNSPSNVVVSPKGHVPSNLTIKPSTYWEIGAMDNVNYPIDCTFFRERFCVLVNKDNQPRVYISNIDDYNNFADKTEGDVLAENAITIKPSSDKINNGVWLLSSDKLYLGTDTYIYAVDSASAAEPMSPDNVTTQRILPIGCANIPAVSIENSTFFVDETGCNLYALTYNYDNDAYIPNMISRQGDHLFNETILDMVYQKNPLSILWIATKTRFIGITISSLEEVVAIHRHKIGGNVVNMEVCPNPDNYKIQDLWMVVEREGFYYIEYIAEDMPSQFDKEVLNIENYEDRCFAEDEFVKRNSTYLDACLSIEREPETKIVSIEEIRGGLKNVDVSVTSSRGTKIVNSGNENFSSVLYLTENEDVTGDDSQGLISWVTDRQEGVFYKFRVAESLVGCRIKAIQYYKRKGGSIQHKTDFILDSTEFSFSTATVDHDERCDVEIQFFFIDNSDVVLKNLDHLEGKEVGIMIDGAEFPRQVVTNGAVVVPRNSKKVVVGLPIESMFIPQTLYMQSDYSSGVGDVQRIDHITLMLWRSMGGFVGASAKQLQPIYFRNTEEKMDNSTPLFTGNKKITVNFGTSRVEDKGATIVIYNDSAFPMNILAIAPHFSTSGGGL